MKIRNFNLYELELFKTVAKAGSFSGAAQISDLPVSSVSRKIKQLEDSANVTLFERQARGLKLTSAGKYLLSRCDVILEGFDTTFANLSQHNTAASGKITVQAPAGAFTLVYNGFLESFHQAYPDIQLDIVSSAINVNFTDDRIDVYLHLGELPNQNVYAKKLMHTPIDYYASADYIAKHGMPRSPESFEQHKFVIYSPFIKSPENWGFNRENPLQIGSPWLISDNMPMCINQVQSGQGIGLLPVHLVNMVPDNQQLIPLFNGRYQYSHPSYVVVPQQAYIPEKVKVFVNSLSDFVQNILLS